MPVMQSTSAKNLPGVRVNTVPGGNNCNTYCRRISSMGLASLWPSGRVKVYDAGSPMRTFAEDPTLPLGMVKGRAAMNVAAPKTVATMPVVLTNIRSPAIASAVGGASVAYCSARARLAVNIMQTAATADTSDW